MANPHLEANMKATIEQLHRLIKEQPERKEEFKKLLASAYKKLDESRR